MHSDPVDISPSPQKAEPEDAAYLGSSVEDELFYSPRSSPVFSDGREAAAQDLTKTPVALKEHFFTPRAGTPEYLKKLVIILFTFIAVFNLFVLFSCVNINHYYCSR